METKNCPYCGEEIRESAMKCKHCGEWMPQERDESLMQWIACPCCAEPIDPDSTKCVHCGESLKGRKKGVKAEHSDKMVRAASKFAIKTWKGVRIASYILFGLGVIWTIGCFANNSQDNDIELTSVSMGLVYLVMRYYVRAVTDKKGDEFLVLALLEFFSFILCVFTFGGSMGYSNAMYQSLFVIIMGLFIAELVFSILCCRTLFRIAGRGINQARSAGWYMIIDMCISLVYVIIMMLKPENESAWIGAAVWGIILDIAILTSMSSMFSKMVRIYKENNVAQKK